MRKRPGGNLIEIGGKPEWDLPLKEERDKEGEVAGIVSKRMSSMRGKWRTGNSICCTRSKNVANEKRVCLLWGSQKEREQDDC